MSVGTLADMYQRIPGDYLSVMKRLQPLNYSILTAPARSHGLRPSIANPTRGTAVAAVRDSVQARWQTRTVSHDATLASALLAVELANADEEHAQKFQLNFSNGVHAVFSRRVQADAASLRCVTLYDPSAAFVGRTAQAAAEGRAPLRARLAYIVDAKGHSLRPRTATPSSFAYSQLYKNAPSPTVGAVGYQFMPVSAIGYQVKPNATIVGCRPIIRETNPQAVHFRPRPLSRPACRTVFEGDMLDARHRASPTPTPSRADRAARLRPMSTQ
jgi:hypothetical protein